MKVSVVIATYRRRASLQEAIESVMNQTYPDIEVIVVDDNADKEWNEAVVAIVQQYPTIQYIRNEKNMGSAESRNIGIRESTGEFITFLDDDDLYLPEKISKQVNAMQVENADYGITDLFLYDEKDKLIDKRVRNFIVQVNTEDLIAYHLKYHMTGTDTMMFRKDYLKKIGGFPPVNVGDEFYLMEKAIRGGGKFCYCRGCYVKAYVHSETNGLSSGEKKVNGENELYAYKKTLWKALDRSDKRYIKMRHYAVLAFAYLRMRKYIAFISNSAHAFFISPIECIKLFLGRKI